MKRVYQFFLLLLALMLPATAIANDFEVGGIYYSIDGNNATVTDADNNWDTPDYSGDVTIPETVIYNGTTYSVTSIDGCAFWNCSGLTSIDIPNSVTSIGDGAFAYCSGLASVTVASDNTKYDSRNDCNAIIETATNTLIVGCQNTIIPNSIISIGDGAFSGCTGLTSIDIPNSIISIGVGAFSGCSELAFIEIPNSVANISSNAFEGTSWYDNQPDGVVYAGLTVYKYKGTMPSGTQITLRDGTTGIASDAFSWFSTLRSIIIPNSVTHIGEFAFAGCYNLTRVTMGDSVTFIGARAFSSCRSLSSIDLPNSVTYIGDGAFSSCSGLTGQLIIPNNVTLIGEDTFFSCEKLTSITIPNSVTYIGNNAFMQCYKLTTVTIPSTVTYIGDGAFSSCYGLTGNLTIPSTVTYIGNLAFSNCSGLTGNLNIPNSVTGIGNYTFSNCSGLTGNLTIPSTVTYIGDGAFQDCSGLTGNLTIPPTVTYIGNYTFSNCSGLTGNLNIPDAVTSIGNNAFYNCSGLTGDLTIPNLVKSIGSSAFYGCLGLTSVTIPDSVATIGTQAFYNCPIIESVTCLSTTPPSTPSTGDMALFNTNVYIHSPLYVPLGTEKSYMYDQGWGQFINIIGIKTQDDVLASDITLNQSVMSMILGTSSQLVATILPDSTTNMAVAWASSNPNVVTVDEDGVVTAMGLGNAMITAVTTDGSNLSATCRVIVTSMSTTNGFAVADAEVMHGKEIVIPVAMNNDQTILAFQTDIFLPEGFNIVMDEDDEYMISPSNRLTEDHILMANGGNGAVSVVCYTPEGRPIGGNSGDDLFYITVQVPEDASGDYVIYLRNSRLTTADYTELRIPDAGAVVTVKSYIPGDANDSRTVTVTDIVVTAQYVLQMNPEPFIFEAADMNGDGEITVTDIMLIAYLIIHPTMDAPKRMPALDGGNDHMSGEGVTLMAGETRTVSIMLDNETDYTAFQMDLTLPEGLTASNFQLTDRAGNHAFDVNRLGNGKTRALCYSPAIEAIEGHEGAILTFDVTATSEIEGSIIVDSIEMVTANCQTVLINAFAIGVNSATGVNELNGANTVVRVDYYNLVGQQVDRPESGVTLVVTTFTDGTRTTAKVIK